MDIVCDLKVKYSTLMGKLFGWILQGPIEGHKFEVDINIEVSKEPTAEFSTAFEIFELHTGTYFGDYEWENLIFQNNKYSRTKTSMMTSPGRMEMRLFLSSDSDFRILGKDNTIHTNVESRQGYTAIPRGSRFYSEPLKVHPFTDVVLLIFAIISSIGAIFEILSFLLKP